MKCPLNHNQLVQLYEEVASVGDGHIVFLCNATSNLFGEKKRKEIEQFLLSLDRTLWKGGAITVITDKEELKFLSERELIQIKNEFRLTLIGFLLAGMKA